MNLVNFTYHMQFSAIFFNNNNESNTKRMNIDVKEYNDINSKVPFVLRQKIRAQIDLLNKVYENSTKTVSKNRRGNTTADFNVENFNRHLVLSQRLKIRSRLKGGNNSKTKQSERKSKYGNIKKRRIRKADADVEKLVELFRKKNISRLDKENIDLVNINDLRGNRRIKRAMSVLCRSLSESEVDMAGLPNQLAPKYQAMRKRKAEILEFGQRIKHLVNKTNKNTEEEFDFMNYTELRQGISKERKDILYEAKEINEFYDLEEAEDAEQWMKDIASYQVDMSQLELKCDLLNNVSGLEYRIHNPELYPEDSVKTNLVKLKFAEERVYSLERKQLEARKAKLEEYHKLVSLGRTTQKSNLTTLSIYDRPRYLADQEKVFGTLYKRFTRTRAEKERAYARLKNKPKTTHFRDYFGPDYIENWYQKGKTFGDFGQDSNADLHMARQSCFRSALYSNIRDGPYNYLN